MRKFFVSALLVAALPFAASAAGHKPELEVYTYDAFAASWGPAPAIEKAFEATCECDLVFTAVESSGALISRLKLEGADTTADVIVGIDTNLTGEAAATGLLAPSMADLSAATVPNADKFDGGLFVPVDYGYFAFVYNSDTVTDVPSSFEELAASDLTIVIQDPRTSTPGLGLLLWIKEAYGDDAPAIWEGLSDQIVTVTKGWSDAYGLFLEGEADMVLSYTTSPAYHLIAEGDDKFASAAFSEGHYMQVELASAVASSDQPELAQKFLQFIVTEGFQDAIPTGNWMYPATDVDLPEGFETLTQPSAALLTDPATVTANSKAWIAEWLAATQ